MSILEELLGSADKMAQLVGERMQELGKESPPLETYEFQWDRGDPQRKT